MDLISSDRLVKYHEECSFFDGKCGVRYDTSTEIDNLDNFLCELINSNHYEKISVLNDYIHNNTDINTFSLCFLENLMKLIFDVRINMNITLDILYIVILRSYDAKKFFIDNENNFLKILSLIDVDNDVVTDLSLNIIEKTISSCSSDIGIYIIHLIGRIVEFSSTRIEPKLLLFLVNIIESVYDYIPRDTLSDIIDLICDHSSSYDEPIQMKVMSNILILMFNKWIENKRIPFYLNSLLRMSNLECLNKAFEYVSIYLSMNFSKEIDYNAIFLHIGNEYGDIQKLVIGIMQTYIENARESSERLKIFHILEQYADVTLFGNKPLMSRTIISLFRAETCRDNIKQYLYSSIYTKLENLFIDEDQEQVLEFFAVIQNFIDIYGQEYKNHLLSTLNSDSLRSMIQRLGDNRLIKDDHPLFTLFAK